MAAGSSRSRSPAAWWGCQSRATRVARTCPVGAGDPPCVADGLIRDVHAESRGTYGGRRVHAELTLGCGVVVGHGPVAMLMRQAAIVGAVGRP